MWVITIAKATENVTKLKSLAVIRNFIIKIQDYKTTDRRVQCFKCQEFAHKAEFCHIKNKCVNCAGRALRLIGRYDRYTRNDVIYSDLEIVKLKSFMKHLALKLYFC